MTPLTLSLPIWLLAAAFFTVGVVMLVSARRHERDERDRRRMIQASRKASS